jgi:hypothetical protein
MKMTSTTERTIKTKLDGESTGGLRRAVRAQERELERLRRAAEKEQALMVAATTKGADKVVGTLATTAKGVLALGSAVGTLQGAGTAVAGTVATVASLSGSLLALPGIAASGAVGIGVLKLATAGFGEALSASDPEEWTEATKDMAPAAVKAAEAIRAQSDRLSKLRKLVQGEFFAGFDSDIRSLADKYFPLAEKHTGGIAANLGLMGRNAATALMAPSSVDAVNTILGATTETAKELEPALGNILGGLLELGGVGAQRTVSLGKAVTNVTGDFRRWVAEGVKTGRINDLIDEGVATAKDLGRVFENLGQIGRKLWNGLSTGERDFLRGIIETTQAVEDFLDSAEGQGAVKSLAETLRVTADVARNVLTTALREAGPIIRDAGPAVQELARGIGEFLTNAIETVGPLLHGLVSFVSDHNEAFGDAVPVVLGLAVAYKGLKVATEVKAWMAGIPGLLGDIETKANGASGAIGDGKGKGGLVGRLGGLKAVAGTVALAAAAKGLDELNESAGKAEDNLGTVEGTLHNIVGAGEDLLSLNFGGIFKDLRDEIDMLTGKFGRGESPIGKLLVGEAGKIDLKINASADISQAERDLKDLKDAINRSQEKVTINGNTVPASTALKTVVDAIEAGKGTVDINGANIDAHRALDDIVNLINRSSGTVNVNGNDVPAGQVLLGLLNRVNGSRAMIGVSADTSGAQGVIDRFITMNNGKTVQIYTSVLGSGGIASAGRLATGGRPFFNGKVTGPGTRTNDKAGLFALSRDEHVLSAAEVEAAGGHAAIYAWRRALMSGARGFADGGAPRYRSALMAPAPRAQAPSVSVAAPQVRVFIGEREITDVVRTVVAADKRQDERRALTGPGGAW